MKTLLMEKASKTLYFFIIYMRYQSLFSKLFLLIGTSLFSCGDEVVEQSGQSLKNLPSLVGPRLPSPVLQFRNSANIFVNPESLIHGFGVNQRLVLVVPGQFSAKEVVLVACCML